MTHALFNKFFLDREGGGFFSHIDPITFDPHARDRSGTTRRARTGTRSATTRRRT